MPEWLLAVLVFGTIFGIPIGWGMLQDKYRDRDDGVGKFFRVTEKAEDVAGGILHSIFQRIVGLVALALGLLVLWLTPTMGLGWETLVAIALAGYGIYLLWPGRRSFWIVF